MKTKKIVLTAAFVLSLTVCPLLPANSASASSPNSTAEQGEYGISPLSDYKVWIYKTENGKMYKRLYNASTDTWIGDWIYVGEA